LFRAFKRAAEMNTKIRKNMRIATNSKGGTAQNTEIVEKKGKGEGNKRENSIGIPEPRP